MAEQFFLDFGFYSLYTSLNILVNMKIWLCGLTSAGNYENLRNMIEPIKEFFDGLQWTFHNPITTFDKEEGWITDPGYYYLDNNKKDGAIISAEWCDRFGYSRNHYLWQGTMQDGDFFVQLDSAERLSPEFCQKDLPTLINEMEQNNVGMVQNYGKGLIFKYNEMLEFRGSPHAYPVNLSGDKVAEAQLDKKDFWSVRDEQRDPFHFVKWYLKYYLYPAGSNHCLLGLEKNGDPQILFGPREERRLKFRKYLRENNIELTPEAVISFFQEIQNAIPDSPTIKDFIENEKILNDTYRYYVLGDKDFKDDHDFKNMVITGIAISA